MAKPSTIDCQPTAINPYLKYPGGKRKLVPLLREYWQPYSDCRLVDLFTGSASVPFGLNPDRVLLNDLNPHTVNLHRWVQTGLEIKVLLQYEKRRYYLYRHWFNSLVPDHSDTMLAATLFYYLNRCCVNGIVRLNSKKEFNVSFGEYKSVNFITDFSPWQERMKNWSLTSVDFAQVELDSSDFVYADPPYDSVAEGSITQLALFPEASECKQGKGFTGYTAKFPWADQVRLAKHLINHPGPVLISNAATQRIIDLYENLGFEVRTLMVKRSVDPHGDRSNAKEIIAWKPPS